MKYLTECDEMNLVSFYPINEGVFDFLGKAIDWFIEKIQDRGKAVWKSRILLLRRSFGVFEKKP